MKTVLMVSGRKDLSKRFVSEVRELGYETQKINPARANREVVRVIVPRGHPEDDRLFRASENFLDEQGGHYLYVASKLAEFLDDSNKKVAIMVNISNELKEQLESDFEAFSVYLSDNGRESVTQDWTIYNDHSFSDKVAKLLRILTKDIEEVQYIKE